MGFRLSLLVPIVVWPRPESDRFGAVRSEGFPLGDGLEIPQGDALLALVTNWNYDD